MLLVVAASGLYVLTPRSLDEEFRNVTNTVRLMQQLGMTWSVETARVRADTSSNFDRMDDLVPRTDQLKNEISDRLRQIPDLPERIGADSRAFIAAMDSIREKSERFKNAFAITRNSERYLPLAGSEVLKQAQRVGNREVAREIVDLSGDLSHFLAAPNETDRTILSERVAKLEVEGPETPSALSRAIADFVAHAQVLLNTQGHTDELFQSITTSSAIASRADELTDSLEAEASQRNRSIVLYQRTSIALCASVLLAWLAVGWVRRDRTRDAPPLRPTIAPVMHAETGSIQPVDQQLHRAPTRPRRQDGGVSADVVEEESGDPSR